MSPLSLLDRVAGSDRRPRRRDGAADRTSSDRVDPRIVARREEIREERRSRRRRLGLIVSIIISVVAVLYGATRSALLDVDTVETTGNIRTPGAEVDRAAGIRTGQPLVEVDAETSARALEALPWVATASVDRSWGGTVAITIVERTPLIALEVDGRVLIVDEQRRVLADAATAPDGLLPVRGLPGALPGGTVDARADGAIALVKALPPGVRSRVTAVSVVGDELQLATRPQGTVRFGTVDQLDTKVEALRTIYGQVDLDDLCTVDVRVPKSAVLTRQERCA